MQELNKQTRMKNKNNKGGLEMDIAWLNFGSLVLGLIAFILPLINVARYEKLSKHWVTLSIVSLSACSISLFLQIYSFYERVKANDWAALMDTMDVIASVPAILLIVTIILNAITLFMYRNKVA